LGGKGQREMAWWVNVFVDFGLRSSYIWVDWTGQDKAFRNGKVSTKPFWSYSLSQMTSLYVAKALLPVEQTYVFGSSLELYNHNLVVKSNVPFEFKLRK